MKTSSRSLWTIRYREARGHAIVLASVSWLAAAVIIFAAPGRRDLMGHLKGADFVHFYTLGRIALTGQTAALYDGEAQHRLQAQWVPESAPDSFVPVYPPQTALLFAPVAWFPYGAAALLWAAVTAVVYALVVRAAWRPARDAISDRTFVIAAAAGFPPFWSLILHGQTTTIPLMGWCLGWLALERRRPFVAGLALGLLAIKPQFGLALAVVVLVCGEWSMLGGALVSAVVQAGAVWLAMGSSVLSAYVETLKQLPQLTHLLEPKPYQLHSIRAVTSLIPWLGTPLWLVLSAVVIWQTVRVWRSPASVAARVGVLIVASVLVSPHLTIYDAAVLVLPLLLLGGWIETHRRVELAATFWPTVYWLCLTYFVPTALFIRVQISVFVLGWLFVKVAGAVVGENRTLAEATPSGTVRS